MDTLLGLVMILAQVFGIVRLFGGAKNSPYWLDVVTAIGQILFCIALFGLIAEYM